MISFHEWQCEVELVPSNVISLEVSFRRLAKIVVKTLNGNTRLQA